MPTKHALQLSSNHCIVVRDPVWAGPLIKSPALAAAPAACAQVHEQVAGTVVVRQEGQSAHQRGSMEVLSADEKQAANDLVTSATEAIASVKIGRAHV